MTTHHLVDPELRPLLEVLPTSVYTDDNWAELRANALPLPVAEDDGVSVDVRKVPGPAGAPDIGLRIYRPEGAVGALPLIYHIHGGGYVMGSAEMFEGMNRQAVAELGCALVSVDYRLAPETAFPGAIEDIYAGLAWCFANAGEQGFDAARIGVMGESAGGGFAAALALLARDRGDYKLIFQHLIYPMLDDRTGTSSSPHDYVGEYVWPVGSNRFGWKALLGKEPGGDDVSPYAAAARATDLSGLPPTFIHVGALDLFLEEDLEYARRLARAGVPIELHLYPGAFHGFELAPGSAVGEQAVRTSRAALKRFLAAKP